MRQGWIRQCGLILTIIGFATSGGFTASGALAADEIVLGSAISQTGKYARVWLAPCHDCTCRHHPYATGVTVPSPPPAPSPARRRPDAAPPVRPRPPPPPRPPARSIAPPPPHAPPPRRRPMPSRP